MRRLNIIDCGTMDYDKVHTLQLEVLKKVQLGQLEDTLILVEHPPVITMGRNAQSENVLFSDSFLSDKGIQLRYVERGGDATYHGFGQLVGYPIFDIKKRHDRSIKKFVYHLEQIFIDYLNQTHDLAASRHDVNPGVWVGEEKICALGLAVKRGVTFHGFALNINTNLEHYQYIVPCGLKDKGVTSIKALTDKAEDITDVKEHIISQFVEKYQFEKSVSMTMELGER